MDFYPFSVQRIPPPYQPIPSRAVSAHQMMGIGTTPKPSILKQRQFSLSLLGEFTGVCIPVLGKCLGVGSKPPVNSPNKDSPNKDRENHHLRAWGWSRSPSSEVRSQSARTRGNGLTKKEDAVASYAGIIGCFCFERERERGGNL